MFSMSNQSTLLWKIAEYITHIKKSFDGAAVVSPTEQAMETFLTLFTASSVTCSPLSR